MLRTRAQSTVRPPAGPKQTEKLGASDRLPRQDGLAGRPKVPHPAGKSIILGRMSFERRGWRHRLEGLPRDMPRQNATCHLRHLPSLLAILRPHLRGLLACISGWLCFFDGRDGRCLTPISATWHEIIIQSKTVCCCTLNSGAYFADDERSFGESEARVCPAPAWGIWKRPLQLLFDADLRKRAQHRPRLPSPAR